jgi:flagellar biosynthesis/type III secretory pathway protein FliH
MNKEAYEYTEGLAKRLKKKRQLALKQAFLRGFTMSEAECQERHLLISQHLSQQHGLKIDIIIRSAQLLVEKYLEQYPKTLIGMAQKVLKNITHHTDAELCAHPDDAKILQDALGEITVGDSTRLQINISKDENLMRGSLVVKAHKSIIDAQICTQLKRAHDVLLG